MLEVFAEKIGEILCGSLYGQTVTKDRLIDDLFRYDQRNCLDLPAKEKAHRVRWASIFTQQSEGDPVD
jgi:hypothetical protein